MPTNVFCLDLLAIYILHVEARHLVVCSYGRDTLREVVQCVPSFPLLPATAGLRTLPHHPGILFFPTHIQPCATQCHTQARTKDSTKHAFKQT